MTSLKANEAPPADYYADNLRTLIQSVLDQYPDLLKREELGFGKTILSLSDDAVRLFTRLIARKPVYIREDSLHYTEIANLDDAVRELERHDFISINSIDQIEDALQTLTVAELRQLGPELDKGLRKQTLIDSLQDCFNEDELAELLTNQFSWLCIEVGDLLALFQLLFFGNSYQQLEEFVIRDLGLSRFEHYPLSRENRMFSTRSHLDRFCELTHLAGIVDEHGTKITDEFFTVVFNRLNTPESNRVCERIRSQTLNALARNLERIEQNAFALLCYERSNLPPARERMMRVLHGESRIYETEEIRQEIFNAPITLEELQFAQRFKRPKHQHADIETRVTDMPEAMSDSIEIHAALELISEGKQAWHLENALAMGLFALAYWDWLFAPVKGAFVNPFQASPLDLYWPEFFESRRDICTDPLKEPEKLKANILNTAAQKNGITSHLVSWSLFSSPIIEKVFEAIKTEQLCNLLSIVVEDLRQFKSGFPDLTVIDQDGKIEFVEVKGPGDQLRPNQRLWIERLMRADIPVSVWRFK